MATDTERLPALTRLPLLQRRLALRALWQMRQVIGRPSSLGVDRILRNAIRLPGAEAAKLDRELDFHDVLSTLEWAALLARSKDALIRDSQFVEFEDEVLLGHLSQLRKPLIFAPLHMGCFALPFGKMMREYFSDRTMLILRAREDRPHETLAMQRISEIGVDMRFLNIADKQNYMDSVRFARAGAVIVSFVDLPASYGGAVPITLFGQPARMAMGVNSLARVTGATVVPLSVQSSLRGDVVRFGQPFESFETGAAEKARVTEIIRSYIEETVLAYPEQWHMWPRLNEFTEFDQESEAA